MLDLRYIIVFHYLVIIYYCNYNFIKAMVNGFKLFKHACDVISRKGKK